MTFVRANANARGVYSCARQRDCFWREPDLKLERFSMNNMIKTAGALLFLAGIVALMGIITAEIFYPPGYSTSQSEISDLGATRPPNSIIVQPSATIFNTTMMVAGGSIMVASYFVYRGFRRGFVAAVILLLGIGMLGVGVFPGSNASIHPLFALLTFLAAGVSAIASASVTSAPFRLFAVVLGGITLLFLVIAFFFASTVFPVLGDGGTERWIAYPAILWITGFGGYMLSGSES